LNESMKHDTALGRTLAARSRVAACAFAAFAIALAAAEQARADPTTVAEALFRDGTQLLDAGRLAEACPKFAESLHADPALGTLLFLATCHERQGRTASAWSEFSSAAEWAQRTGRNDRLVFAQKHRAALEGKLSTVIIRAAITAGIEVRVDEGALVVTAPMATPLPLDPGEHWIEARAPGHYAWRTRVTVPADHAALTVDVPPLIPSPVAIGPADRPAASAESKNEPSEPSLESKKEPPEPTSGVSISPVLTWSAAGLAGAGLVVGSLFGALTLNARDAARAACPNNQCFAGGLDDIDRARTYATGSTIAFGVGLAAAIATGYMWIVNGSRASTTPAAATHFPVVAPAVSPQQASISIAGRFE